MDKLNPWTFAGQEAIREQETQKMSFIEKCRAHDELWESAKLFFNGNQTSKQHPVDGLKHLHQTMEITAG